MIWSARGEGRLEVVAETLTAQPQTAQQIAEGARLRGLSVTQHGVVFFLYQLVERGLARRCEGEPTRWARRDDDP